jgi:hypothetical protein
MTSQLASEAMIPNPRLAAFKPFIGTWTTIGSHSMIPGVTLHGRTSFEWHDGGAFVRVLSETDEPKIPSATSIIGSDDDAESFTMLYFDERAVTRWFNVSTSDGVLQWWRTAPGFSQRYVLTVAPDGETLRGVSSLSKDDKTWEQDMELRYTRVK